MTVSVIRLFNELMDDRAGRRRRHAVIRLFNELMADWDRDWRTPVRWLLFGPFRRQTIWNLAYLIFSAPLGVLYFMLLGAFLLGGLAFSVVLIGIPVVLLGLAIARWANAVERHLAWRWLGVPIPAPLSGQGERLLRRIGRFLRDPVTWTNILFLFLKLPIGAVLWWALWWGLSHLWYLLLHPVATLFSPIFGQPDPTANVAEFGLGVVLIVPALHTVNLATYVYGRYARLMLGPSESTLRVEVSEAEAARERINAARAEQSRRELMVNVSHELRTPVASIRGHVESLMIAADQADGAPQHEPMDSAQLGNYLGIIHRETERLGALVDDLLALARSEAGELSLALRPTDAVDVVREIHETLAPLAWRERSVTVIVERPGRVPLAMADRDRLAQVLLNLVRNAITHTPAGGIVSMTVAVGPADGQPEPGSVTISVADTGAGIAADDLDQIFERFYRVDASRNRASGGFGLGLSIVKDLVTAMGGTVSVESTVGEGSAFHVSLRPAATATAVRPRTPVGVLKPDRAAPPLEEHVR